MIGIPLGLAYANAYEWVVHKYVLHGTGRKPKSFWSFHWLEHHRAARLNGFRDADYERSVLGWNAQGKEAFGVVLGAAAGDPTAAVAQHHDSAGSLGDDALAAPDRHRHAVLEEDRADQPVAREVTTDRVGEGNSAGVGGDTVGMEVEVDAMPVSPAQ